jgi:hypothetical protein
MFVYHRSNGSLRIQKPRAKISTIQINDCEKYICGVVDGRIRLVKEPFYANDLFGGNGFWQHTPLIDLYNWHKNHGTKNPFNKAGIDVGRLLKSVLKKHPQLFLTALPAKWWKRGKSGIVWPWKHQQASFIRT